VKWEYRFVAMPLPSQFALSTQEAIDAYNDAILEKLNAYGAEGWEIFQTERQQIPTGPTGYLGLYMKRAIPSPQYGDADFAKHSADVWRKEPQQ
jgi:hypothetical protein